MTDLLVATAYLLNPSPDDSFSEVTGTPPEGNIEDWLGHWHAVPAGHWNGIDTWCSFYRLNAWMTDVRLPVDPPDGALIVGCEAVAVYHFSNGDETLIPLRQDRDSYRVLRNLPHVHPSLGVTIPAPQGVLAP